MKKDGFYSARWNKIRKQTAHRGNG